MQLSVRYVVVVVWCLLQTVALPDHCSFANMSTGFRSAANREVVNCFFGASRHDGRIMVNMVPGAAGKVYRIAPTAPVTLNGISVGLKYLENGMPIVLILNGQMIVDEIQVRPVGGK